ncbi:MAG TPA: hypothetical protein VFH47_04115 [Candidatus Thermoplasmatota archaeon]|nr:hypothetical protein [Candidatus Thermoplasmatota archaeon]
MVQPPLSLEAAISGKRIDEALTKGRQVVYVLHGANDAEVAKEVSKACRARYPSAKDLLLVSVVDLKPMAGLWRRMADSQLRQTYEKLTARAKEHVPGEDPQEHVLIVADWEGTVRASMGLGGERAAALVVGRDGKPRGSAMAPGLPAKVAELLE